MKTRAGVLVVQVVADSPADEAELRGSYKPMTIDGEEILVGGDVITAFDGETVTSIEDLQDFLSSAQPDDNVKLTILRDGKKETVRVRLA